MEIDEPRSLQTDAGEASVLYVGAEPRHVEDAADSTIDVTTAQTADDARERLARSGVDCVVSEHDLPGTDGVEFLAGVRERRPRLPLLLLADEPDEELVEAAVDAGVTDCLDPARVACRGELLARRVRAAATARRAVEADLVRETERLARTGGWYLALPGGDLRVTPGCRRLHGLGDAPDSVDGLIECYHSDDQQTLRTALIHAKEAIDEVVVVTDEATIETVPTAGETGGQVYLPELRLRPDAAPDRVVKGRIESVTSDGEVTAITGAVSDATDHRRREAEVRRYERVADDLPVGLFRATPDGEFASVNQTLVGMLGADSKVHLHDTGADVVFAGKAEGLSGWLDGDGRSRRTRSGWRRWTARRGGSS
jgi:CheY-like chemotaxis protein